MVHSLPSFHLLLGWHFSIALLPTSLPCFLLSESLCWLPTPSEGAYLGVQGPSQINHKFASSLHASFHSIYANQMSCSSSLHCPRCPTSLSQCLWFLCLLRIPCCPEDLLLNTCLGTGMVPASLLASLASGVGGGYSFHSLAA